MSSVGRMLKHHFACTEAGGDKPGSNPKHPALSFLRNTGRWLLPGYDSLGNVTLLSTGLQWGHFCIVAGITPGDIKTCPAHGGSAPDTMGDALRSLMKVL